MINKFHLFEYHNYRHVLHDWFWLSKQKNPKLSFRYIAKNLSLKAPNHFHLVITQKRHLSLPILEKVMRLMKLSSMERQYLKLLFQENTAKSEIERHKLQEQRKLLLNASQRDDQNNSHLEIVGHVLAWYIKMGATLFEGRTREQICSLVKSSANFSTNDRDINNALEILLNARQLEFVDEAARFEGGSIVTKWDFDSTEIKRHHRSNLGLAMESIAWPLDQRFLSSVTIPCNDELYQWIIAEVRSLCLKILERSNHQIVSPDETAKIATLQLALFPYFSFNHEKSSPVYSKKTEITSKS